MHILRGGENTARTDVHSRLLELLHFSPFASVLLLNSSKSSPSSTAEKQAVQTDLQLALNFKYIWAKFEYRR